MRKLDRLGPAAGARTETNSCRMFAIIVPGQIERQLDGVLVRISVEFGRELTFRLV